MGNADLCIFYSSNLSQDIQHVMFIVHILFIRKNQILEGYPKHTISVFVHTRDNKLSYFIEEKLICVHNLILEWYINSNLNGSVKNKCREISIFPFKLICFLLMLGKKTSLTFYARHLDYVEWICFYYYYFIFFLPFYVKFCFGKRSRV